MKCFLLFFHVVLIQVPTVFLSRYQTQENVGLSLSTKYEPKVRVKMCYLNPSPGPCRANIKMYYYSPETKTCETFSWGGCQGNGNRFDSKSECLQACLTQPDEPRKRPRYCELGFDYGFCFGAVKRWYYDRLWKVCKERIYSGCGGNKNNFYSYEQCDQICRLSKASRAAGKRRPSDGGRKVVYVYTNGTKRARPSTLESTFTSPSPRYFYITMNSSVIKSNYV